MFCPSCSVLWTKPLNKDNKIRDRAAIYCTVCLFQWLCVMMFVMERMVVLWCQK